MNPDQMMRDYFGINYDSAMALTVKTKASVRRKFLKENPYADMSKFRIFVVMGKNGKVLSTDVDYVIDEDDMIDVTSDAFKNNPIWTQSLGWPGLWSVEGTLQDFEANTRSLGDLNSVEIYVTDNLSFRSDLDAFDISSPAGGNSSPADYKTDSYMAALYAAYIATYLCGISVRHFVYKPSVPKIITSIARYHVYYHMMRFLKNPDKMSRYISEAVKKVIGDHRPTKVIWEKKMHYGREDLGTWLSDQARGTIRNARPILRGNQGQVGISYEKAMRRTIVGLEDYKVFVAEKSDGLTKLGQLLFQQSIESYVYCVLGAQAKTRWPIVRSGARSLQTQEVFRKLVGDTVLQDDHTVTLGNMRGAIKTTNVVLNTAVSPVIILIPSDMIILDKMISGYNNVLTIAKKGMKFGHNEGVNYFEHHTIRLPPPATRVSGTPIPTISRAKAPILSSDSRENVYVFLASGLVGSAVAWLVL